MDRLFLFVVTTPAGTPQGNPVVTPMPLEDAKLQAVRIVIPSGHVGLTGIRLLQANQQIIPFANNSYLVGNDRVIMIPFDGEMTVSGLVANSYNTGQFIHKHYVEIEIADLPLRNAPSTGGQSAPAIVPALAPIEPDPLSPDVLIASVPDTIFTGDFPLQETTGV